MRLRTICLCVASPVVWVLAQADATGKEPDANSAARAPEPSVVYRFSDDRGGATNFVSALTQTLDALPSDVAEPRFTTLFPKERFANTDEQSATLRDFVRLRALFEATRDAGFFGVRWAVTNEEPSSIKLWNGLQKSAPKTGERSLLSPSVTGECDEISALFAFLSTHVGVKQVGLFWPTNNHTIAAWTPKLANPGKSATKILIPTTQIFQTCEAGFGTTTFKPEVQKTVYAYQAHDLPKTAPIADGAFFLSQIQIYAPASDELLALLRLDRGQRYDTSFGECTATRQSLIQTLSSKPLSSADRRALNHYLATERSGQPQIPALTDVRALQTLAP